MHFASMSPQEAVELHLGPEGERICCPSRGHLSLLLNTKEVFYACLREGIHQLLYTSATKLSSNASCEKTVETHEKDNNWGSQLLKLMHLPTLGI